MDKDPNEDFAINIAALAREIAMDIFPVEKILEIHKLSDEEWQRISASPHFQMTLQGLIAEWQSASNTRERVKIKAATGLEMQLEHYISDLADLKIPLAQRTEAGKFLARLGELDGQRIGEGGGGGAFSITLNIGNVTRSEKVGPTIEGSVVRSSGAIPEPMV